LQGDAGRSRNSTPTPSTRRTGSGRRAMSIKREALRTMAPHGLFAHCAFLQAIADAGLNPPDISNLQTGLNAASGGSPFLTHYHYERMQRLGVMRCSPLGHRFVDRWNA
jgi:3-oxoacyl-(acyl-carrier-protein) synthase